MVNEGYLSVNIDRSGCMGQPHHLFNLTETMIWWQLECVDNVDVSKSGQQSSMQQLRLKQCLFNKYSRVDEWEF